MGGGCCVSPHSLEGSRARGAIGRHGAAPSGPSGDFGVPMWDQGLDPGVGHAGGGWGRTRSRPRWVLFPTGPGILGAKAKGVIKEGGGGTGPEGVRGRHHVPSHGRPFLGCLGTARSLPPPALEVVALLHPVQPEVLAVFSPLLAGFVVVVLVMRVAVAVPVVPPCPVRPPG